MLLQHRSSLLAWTLHVYLATRIMTDHHETKAVVLTSQTLAGTPMGCVLLSMATAGTLMPSASKNSMTVLAIQAAQHSTSGPKDIGMQVFIVDSDPNKTGCR